MPVTIPGSLATSLQAPMVAAIAEIYGHDSKSEQVRAAILLCMIGTAMEDVAKQAGVTLGGKAVIQILRNVQGKVLIDINKRVGFRLLTKFGERGVLNLAKLVPLVGGAVGAHSTEQPATWSAKQPTERFDRRLTELELTPGSTRRWPLWKPALRPGPANLKSDSPS